MATTAQTFPDVYNWTGPTGVEFTEIKHPSGTYYRKGTDPKVIQVLEEARQSGKKVRLFYGDPDTGKLWHEEYDVCGTIGRSMGPLKVPLLIEGNASGGGSILQENIMRIIVDHQQLYRHPKYREPKYEVNYNANPVGDPPLRWEVYVDGTLHARFGTSKKADRWIAFMRGQRMSK
jgi:hypothetical protein